MVNKNGFLESLQLFIPLVLMAGLALSVLRVYTKGSDKELLYPSSGDQMVRPKDKNKKDVRVKVSYVIDGDTVVLDNKDKVRLLGINAPEMNLFDLGPEDFAQEATGFLKKKLTGQEVTLKFQKNQLIDSYNRTLAYVYWNGVCINALLLEKGLARVYPSKKRHDETYRFKKLEKIAKKNKMGLWSILKTNKDRWCAKAESPQSNIEVKTIIKKYKIEYSVSHKLSKIAFEKRVLVNGRVRKVRKLPHIAKIEIEAKFGVLSLVIFPKNFDVFPMSFLPELKNKTFYVWGEMAKYEGKPEITLQSLDQLIPFK